MSNPSTTTPPDTASASGWNWWLWGGVALAVIVLLGLVSGDSGCSSSPQRPGSGQSAANQPTISDDLFDSATETLDRLEQFDTEPALRLVLDRLNQWIELEKPTDPWKLDPLVSTLPDEPPGLANVKPLKSAAALRFTNEDGNHLLETNWLRNIARVARGNQADDLSRAQQLFDWTIRNIQLDDYPSRLEAEGDAPDMALTVRDVLLFGHGDYVHRAWVFMLLARQENLDVVLLATPSKRQPHGLRPWLPALLHEDKLYLFDTELGLPIPGKDGQSIATLDQVRDDDSLLRALDLPDEEYGMQADDLKDVVALIEASPEYLSHRMQVVEARLAGDRKVVLSVDASALAKRLEEQSGVNRVKLWAHPYDVILERQTLPPQQWQPLRRQMMPFMVRFPKPRRNNDIRQGLGQDEHPLFMGQAHDQAAADRAPLEYQACSLWMGRVLHFKGMYTGDGANDGASTHYMEVRVADAQLEETIDKFVESMQFPDPRLSEAFRQSLEMAIPEAKQHASYWLGLAANERGNHSVAVDYFKVRTLEHSPDGPWTYGARYNLARTYEDQASELSKQQPEEAAALRRQAIELLEKDDSPQAHGNKLRARRLSGQLLTAAAAT